MKLRITKDELLLSPLFRVLPLAILLLSPLAERRAFAVPPPPPEGCVWVNNERFSDEFNGTALDRAKWFDHHPTWKGRPPAKFVPAGVAVTNGCLELRAGTLPRPDGPFTLAGAAVVSRSAEAHYGYYEARMKASKISMSSTFWLSGGRRRIGNASVSQEIDITETIGAPRRHPEWNQFMNSNTHFFRSGVGPKEDLSTPGKARLSSPAADAFHTYAAWWVDANTVQFYLDDEYKFTLHPKTDYSATPFDRPMHVNMVAETYNWETPPAPADVNNADINTTRYDWVRAYVLGKAGETNSAIHAQSRSNEQPSAKK